MFDHVGLRVRDLARSMQFFEQVLAPLGLGLQAQGSGYAGFGPAGAPALWLYVCVRGAGRIEVIQATTGASDTPSRIPITGVRNVGSTSSM